ncbi:hypothetical protein POX_e07093 [Penicillium oxalicum]|uniref:hypothetical protein n=1 Tax=Penicillium oxalicum TaxID=69781 RepID=UPI0020B8A9E1|nr:hypothetical protein POX_e07093 [Penicillium oxalicum]KAI2789066.1 hypothetical protein POX_e07093 [Penicillium oxalicum]
MQTAILTPRNKPPLGTNEMPSNVAIVPLGGAMPVDMAELSRIATGPNSGLPPGLVQDMQ